MRENRSHKAIINHGATDVSGLLCNPCSRLLARAPAAAILPPIRPVPSHDSARYEDLDGGTGREVFFRPTRYRRADLGPLQPVAHVILGNHSHACQIVDVSQNGVAFQAPPALILQTGNVLAHVMVTFDEHEAYHGGARVVSVRDDYGSRVVGVSLNDALMNIDDVLVMRDVQAWAGEHAKGSSRSAYPWCVNGHDRFKSLVAELRLFLEDAQKQLSALEASLPFQVVHVDFASPARMALIERVRKEFVSPIVRYSEQIDAVLRDSAPQEWQALKQYSLRQVHELLMLSPAMARARYKPLGYPGDFEVMRFIYEREFEGTNLFSKALTLACVDTAAAQGVKSRKDFLKAQLSRLITAGNGSKSPTRILSIAAGPAQEVFEVLNELPELPAPIEILLFDQEQQALSYAYTRLKRLTDARWPKAVNIVYRHDTIKRLLTDHRIFEEFGEFHIVFACGLFDYLQSPTASKLCRSLYRCVAPGGNLYVGNMVPTHPTRWLMEHHLDWFLVYRTHEEMLSFARQAAPAANVAIVGERPDVNPFVRLTRT